MKFIIAKIILLSFVFMTAGCSDKEVTEKQNKEEVNKEEREKKAPLGQFKATEPRDKSTYKNPTF